VDESRERPALPDLPARPREPQPAAIERRMACLDES
jgi:hypothetical protein